MSKKRVSLDEEFLQWWEQSLEENGYDMNKKQVKVLVNPTDISHTIYSYREMFEGMRRGEYGPLLAYNFAYYLCRRLN